MKSRLTDWTRRIIPRREDLEENRFIGALARRPELWRLTRRSVPRGVAIGLLVGIFALIPGIQIIGAAFLCVPCRGNIPLAAAMTFLSNPASTPFIIAFALFLGNRLGFSADLDAFLALYHRGAGANEWVNWLVSDAAPALVLGLFVFASVSAALGYVISSFFWRSLVGRRRRSRLDRANALKVVE